ncbi:MAG TPA: thioredoxin domain-containing protein [Actinomycetes bacterium]|jgi:uncharacterized protein YyaL (SSP411 family)|nr:thioredoxin domain-containing protein [Actinomycetes bacterium]
MAEPAERRAANRLAGATSPYLLQHAANPVDWYPWGPEALERARREDRPVLLSIGYAACHWCHVMAHESFEDPQTAALMNEHFVCVKVDREERPDLDAIYMTAVQAMTGQGGWPMTVFLTPEGEPFFAGTYFPNEDRLGMPAFGKVLRAVAEAWRDRRDQARSQGRQVAEHISLQTGALQAGGSLEEGVLREAFEGIRRSFDPEWGGFGGAPKFPQPMTLDFLLRCHLRGWPDALGMAQRTLDRMAAGGIFDQLGGGFHRYSTDHRWLVPHFEKMLYDNAQLVRLYARLWQVTGAERHRQVARRTADYLLRELRHPEGGFFSSQDADSEGEEGRFFVWSYEELVEVAGEAVASFLGAVPEGNWEGRNVLWTPFPPEAVAERIGMGVDELERELPAGRDALLERRERRVHPATDDKVLAAWNGLAIAALAEAGRVLPEPRYVDAAVAAAEFVLGTMRAPLELAAGQEGSGGGGGRLRRAWRQGRLGGPGYLDDYACMAEACLTLYETTFEPRWLREAQALADQLLELFADPEGGFYQTGADAERLVVRPRELLDNAVPAGSSVAADVLLRLGRLLGSERYEQAALGALRVVQGLFARAPTAFGYALGAADFALSRVREVAIVGEPAARDTHALLAEVRRRYRPNQVVALAAPANGEAVAGVPLLADRPVIDGRATAYVCEHFSCRQPVTEPEALAEQLS